MDEDTKPKIMTVIISIIAVAPMLYLCHAYLYESASLFSDNVLVLWFFFLLVIIIWAFLHTALHELGHVIFGKLSGYEFLGVSVFGIWLLKDPNGRMRIRYLRIRGAGGGTIMTPKNGYDENTPYALFLRGGVLMNVLTVIFLVVLIVLDIWPQMNFFIGMAAMLGLVLAITNYIPMTFGSIVNDASLLRLFRKDDASKHCMYFLQRMFHDYLNGMKLDHHLDNVPSELPAGNRLADGVRLNIAELMIQRGMPDTAEQHILGLLGDLKGDGTMMRLTKIYLLFVRTVYGADKETIDAIYDEKMKKFVVAYAGAVPVAMLFLVAYGKRFNTGDASVDKIVKRFNAMMKKSKFDMSFEKRTMETVLSEQWEYLPKIN